MDNFEPTLLGSAVNRIPQSPEEANLEAFPNQYSKRDYWVTLDAPHFTSLCPVTGQPDFARILIEYIPDELVVETKSLKFYLQSFRDQKGFNEQLANRILDDLVDLLDPRKIKVTGEFVSRGGIQLTVKVEHEKA